MAMTAEQKAANLNSLAYIKTLASSNNVNIAEWNILSLFSQADGVNLFTDKKALNKIFFEQLEKVKKQKKEEQNKPEVIQNVQLQVEKIKGAFIEAAKKVRATEIQTLRNNLYYQEDAVKKASQNLDVALKAYNDSQRKIMSLEQVTDVDQKYLDTLKGIQKVIAEEIWVNPVYENGYLYLNTNTSVMLHETNKLANLDLHVDVGQLAVRINIAGGMNFEVIPYKNNITVGGYFHPHVRPEGGICWGEAQTAAMKNIANLELDKALRLLHALLNSYNGGSPYMQLARLKSEGQKMTRVPDNVKHPDKRKTPEVANTPASVAVPPLAVGAIGPVGQIVQDLDISF